MGQVSKDNVKDYWSTDPTIVTPVFSPTVSRNHFEQNGKVGITVINLIKNDSSRLLKTGPVYEYLL